MNTNLTCAPKPSLRHKFPKDQTRFRIDLADPPAREAISRLRYQVYAEELGQYPLHPAAAVRDPIDDWNIYLVASVRDEIAGFISVTAPTAPRFGLEKYLRRDQLPFSLDAQTFEVRLLTVLKPHRGRELATLLMYAALRWVEAHGGNRLVAIGRREVLELYVRCGLESTRVELQVGNVSYELLAGSLAEIHRRAGEFTGLLERLEEKTDWRLNIAFRRPAPCFHGGAFFEAIGTKFDALERRQQIINADVLDAWFPPSPKVINAVEEHLTWLLRTSPPTACEGLVEAIATARGTALENILPGAGSSDLIFRALRQWLKPNSQVLILDPTYGEYAHVLEKVIGCTVDRLTLSRLENYDVDLNRLAAALAEGYDLVVLVNPNSPTGRHISRSEMERVLSRVPIQTRVWVDETYVEYAGPGQSLEPFAVRTENVAVCKSMSKVYALSGARVAYLCAAPHQLEDLRSITPPWVVSLPAQLAAVRALQDPEYYAARYAETTALRESLAAQLGGIGFDVVPGVANFLLCHGPAHGPDAATIVDRCRSRGLFVRDARAMGTRMDNRTLRIAVKDAETNRRIVAILSESLAVND